MVAKILANASLFEFLLQVDIDMAKDAKATGCMACSSALDCANYPRKPRGGPPCLGEKTELRFSFCCRMEGCRRRKTPPSTRFLGRKVYWGGVILIASAMMGDIGTTGRNELSRLFGADRHTLRRWQTLFSEVFPKLPAWKLISARMMPPLASENHAHSLLVRFGVYGPMPPESFHRLSKLLIFISPLGHLCQEI